MVIHDGHMKSLEFVLIKSECQEAQHHSDYIGERFACMGHHVAFIDDLLCFSSTARKDHGED